MQDSFIILGDLGLVAPNGRPITFYYPGMAVDRSQMTRRGELNLAALIELSCPNPPIQHKEAEHGYAGGNP